MILRRPTATRPGTPFAYTRLVLCEGRRDRSLPAQRLVDRLRNQVAIGGHRRELLGMRQQSGQQHAGAAIGGVAARVHQLAQEGDEHIVGQTLAVDFDGGEMADQVGSRILTLLDEQSAEEGAELGARLGRSEEHTSELQSLMRISYAV